MSTSSVYYIRERDYEAQKNGKSPEETFTNLRSRRDILMNSLGKFYESEDNLLTLLPIVTGDSPLSLRVIDWFVTNYAKDHNVMYDLHNEKGERTKFMVYLDYKAQLKAYSKKQFDPFCRRERILFYVDLGEKKMDPLRTTVGQLNFFRWAIQNKVIHYIQTNLANIEHDMNDVLRGGKGERKRKGRRARSRNTQPTIPKPTDPALDQFRVSLSNPSFHEGANSTLTLDDHDKNMTLSATKQVNKHNVTITVKFD